MSSKIAKKFNLGVGLSEATTGLGLDVYQKLCELANRSEQELGIEIIGMTLNDDHTITIEMAGQKKAYYLQVNPEGRMTMSRVGLDNVARLHPSVLLASCRSTDLSWSGVFGLLKREEGK